MYIFEVIISIFVLGIASVILLFIGKKVNFSFGKIKDFFRKKENKDGKK